MRPSFAPLLAWGFANVAFAAVVGAAASPLEKVVLMLGDLRSKLLSDAEAEAATYDKFACFCKEKMAASTEAVAKGKGMVDSLQADVEAHALGREEMDEMSSESVGAISALEHEIEDLKVKRKTQRLQYEKSEVDMSGAVSGLEMAIQHLRSAETATSFVDLRSDLDTIQRAALMAEALGSASTGAAAHLAALKLSEQGQLRGRRGLVQLSDPDVPSSVYEFKSGDIVATLEDLKTKFRDKKSSLDDEEVANRHDHDSQVQAKTAEIAQHQRDLDDSKSQREMHVQQVAQGSKDLSDTSAQLLTDQRYLTDLSGKCNGKAVMWDQRTDARSKELAALTQTLGLVEALASKREAALLTPARPQIGVPPRPAPNLRGPGAAVRQSIGINLPKRVQGLLATTVGDRRVQRRSAKVRRHDLGVADARARLLGFLRSRAASVRSVTLLKLSREVADDPFAKVKQLIQATIERLLDQQESEANHHGWCKKETALAKQSRGQASQALEELNSMLALGETRQEELMVTLDTIRQDMFELNATLANATALRGEEQAENEASIKDAEEGAAAVAEAKRVLTEFYSNAADGAGGAALLQTVSAPQDDGAPDAGFDAAYAGAVGDQVGIMGMLEVVESDFASQAEQTREAEKKAAQEFLELETTMKSTGVQKQTEEAARAASLSEAKGEEEEGLQKMAADQDKLDKALGELAALDAACNGGGQTAEERKMQRDQEMEALKQALCILNSHASGNADAC